MSCSSPQKETECIDDTSTFAITDKETILFSFSLYEPLDLIVSQGVYQVAYRNCELLDTISGNIGPVLLSKDSLLYVRIVAANEKYEDSSYEYMYQGDLSELRLATSEKSEPIYLPLFDVNFSSFCNQGQTIYYWGFENGKVYACSYDFKTKKQNQYYLAMAAETDFFGEYDVPYIYNNKIHFSFSDSKWEIELKNL